MQGLSIGLSALRVNQRLLDLIGQNIANANTPGYHRQVADLASLYFGGPVGDGVEIKQIRRLNDRLLEEAVFRNASETEGLAAQLESLRQIQSLFTPGDGSLDRQLEQFFNQIEQLAARPDNLAQRREFLNSAVALAQGLNALNGELRQVRAGLDASGAQIAERVNSLTAGIAELNVAIQRIEILGKSANDLRDQRGQLLSELSSLVDVRTVEEKFGVVNVIAAGAPLVIGSAAVAVQYKIADDGTAGLVTKASPGELLPVTGGRLAGQLAVRNEVIPDLLGRLDALAKELIRRVDALHATGLGLNGPAAQFSGHRRVTDPTVPLAQAGLDFPPQQGSLFLSVTHLSSGARRIAEVVIDPVTQSLQDVANAINAVADVQAVVDPQANTLTILAAPGYAVDFAGRLPTVIDTSGISGTAQPRVGGAYTGTANDAYTFRVVGSGTVGVTAGLSLEVRNSAGAVIDRLNIGAGYEAGAALKTANGVTVSLGSGTVNDGDAFTVPVVAEADTAGILSALGLNTFFTGSLAADIAVRPELRRDPALLAASRTGQPADNANLLRLARLRETPLLAGGTQTFRQFVLNTISDIGGSIQGLSQQHAAKEALGQGLSDQLQAISGVDANEELLHLLQFQRAYQFSARYLSVVNETLNDLLSIL